MDRTDRVPAQPEYVTSANGYQRVTLEDGSILSLNSNSLVQVNYTAGERRVHLRRGEVFFTVAKNKSRPFIVEVGSVSVRAVGTAFNVRMERHDVEVLVAEGRVKLEHQTSTAGEPSSLPELGVGQRLLISSRSNDASQMLDVQTLPLAEVRESLAWQEPRLRFVDTPLASVVAQFNERNRIQIVLGDARLETMPVDGSFRAENVEAFIRLLESTGGLVAERVNENRIVLRRAR
jgi:transmembrane sensor